jgi:hypothetical protein
VASLVHSPTGTGRVRLGEQEHLSLTSCWVDMYFRFTMAGVGSRPYGVYFQLRRVQVDLQGGVCVRRREAETEQGRRVGPRAESSPGREETQEGDSRGRQTIWQTQCIYSTAIQPEI